LGRAQLSRLNFISEGQCWLWKRGINTPCGAENEIILHRLELVCHFCCSVYEVVTEAHLYHRRI
jgi:hypothetical protein